MIQTLLWWLQYIVAFGISVYTFTLHFWSIGPRPQREFSVFSAQDDLRVTCQDFMWPNDQTSDVIYQCEQVTNFRTSGDPWWRHVEQFTLRHHLSLSLQYNNGMESITFSPKLHVDIAAINLEGQVIPHFWGLELVQTDPLMRHTLQMFSNSFKQTTQPWPFTSISKNYRISDPSGINMSAVHTIYK